MVVKLCVGDFSVSLEMAERVIQRLIYSAFYQYFYKLSKK